MEKRDLKKYKSVIIMAVLVLVAFACGTYFGEEHVYRHTPSSSEVSALNDGTAPTSVNMDEFWEVWNILDQKFVNTHPGVPLPSVQDRVYSAIQGLASAYGDPYTIFMPPQENTDFQSDIAGNFGGVGMELAVNDNNQIVVIAPLEGTPAAAAGVKPGDIILSIDGTSTSELSVDQAVDMIRGAVGTKVTIGIQRQGQANPIQISMTRENITIPTINTETKGDIFVIQLYNFYQPSDNDFRNALRQFVQSGKTKLILDLRGNPGGYLDSAVDMASYFLPLGKTIVTEDFGSSTPEQVYTSKGYNIFANSNLKMVILVDQGTASAAEILSGALQQNGVAILVGTRTFGKGSVQELLSLSSNTSLKITIARWLTPNGSWISGNGLTPNYEVPITATDTADGIDPQMNKAIQLLDQTN